MRFQYDTIVYNLEESSECLTKLLNNCKKKKLVEGEFLPKIEHIILHLNLAYNARCLSRSATSKLKKTEYKKYSSKLKRE